MATPSSLTTEGLSTLYGHNSSITTKAGKLVLQGDIIAKVGSTGVSTDLICIEVRQDGTRKILCAGFPDDQCLPGSSILIAFGIRCMDS